MIRLESSPHSPVASAVPRTASGFAPEVQLQRLLNLRAHQSLPTVLGDCFQYWNSQFATEWFFSEHHRRTVHPIDEPNPQGDSPNPGLKQFLFCFLPGFFETLF